MENIDKKMREKENSQIKNQKNPETEYQTRINLSGIIGKLKGKK